MVRSTLSALLSRFFGPYQSKKHASRVTLPIYAKWPLGQTLNGFQPFPRVLPRSLCSYSWELSICGINSWIRGLEVMALFQFRFSISSPQRSPSSIFHENPHFLQIYRVWMCPYEKIRLSRYTIYHRNHLFLELTPSACRFCWKRENWGPYFFTTAPFFFQYLVFGCVRMT